MEIILYQFRIRQWRQHANVAVRPDYCNSSLTFGHVKHLVRILVLGQSICPHLGKCLDAGRQISPLESLRQWMEQYEIDGARREFVDYINGR